MCLGLGVAENRCPGVFLDGRETEQVPGVPAAVSVPALHVLPAGEVPETRGHSALHGNKVRTPAALSMDFVVNLEPSWLRDSWRLGLKNTN